MGQFASLAARSERFFFFLKVVELLRLSEMHLEPITCRPSRSEANRLTYTYIYTYLVKLSLHRYVPQNVREVYAGLTKHFGSDIALKELPCNVSIMEDSNL